MVKSTSSKQQTPEPISCRSSDALIELVRLLARSAARDVLVAPSRIPASSDERGVGDDC